MKKAWSDDPNVPLQILLADHYKDDCFIISKAMNKLHQILALLIDGIFPTTPLKVHKTRLKNK